uniref:Uncharacterized protein n=1 Tax=Avena sativa TaxID=4498 RepID=A0ACD5XPS5_AVESA
MSGKGKRRSARLLKLEEQKNDDDVDACRLDPWQIIRNIVSRAAHGKRKKNGEIQKLQGEASSSQAIDTAYTGNISGKGPTSGQIIEHILDTLEMRDRLDLFTMPDDIQVCDYAERINRPSDFATLRQKNTDGMYQTLEQFENDVYMVFQKAISINSQDTIPYREAMSLMDQAKQVFLSLKSNRIYTEPELLAWSQKQLDVGPNKPGRDQEDGNGVGGSHDVAVAPAQQRPSSTPVKRKDAGAVTKQISLMKKAGNISADKGKARLEKGAREGKSTPQPVKRARKATMATAAEVEPGDARLGKRRLTYKYNGDRGRGRAIMTPPPLMLPALGDRHARLVQHPQVQGHTYHDSLRRFVRHAGLRARLAAEFRSLECEDRARQNPSQASYWNGFATRSCSYYPASPSSLSFLTPPPSGCTIVEEAPECKLETDSLVKLALRMHTPEFSESAKQVSCDTRGKGSSKDGDEIAVTEAVVPVPAPAQTSGTDKTASAVDFGPFAPPKLAPGRLGFGQFAGSSARPFKVKPPSLNSNGKKKRE